MSRWTRQLGSALAWFVAAPAVGIDAAAQNAATASVPTFAEPGDIWTVPSSGGVARLLVSNPSNESRPLYSPDGRKLAFISTRTGGGDIYVLTFASGDLRRLTFDDGLDQLDAWSPDGKPRDRGHERRVPRELGWRHADAAQRRPVRERVLGSACA